MKRQNATIFASLLLLSVIPHPLSARTWYVKQDGSGDVPTIQAAIDSAAQGDTVLVAAGRYTWANQGTGDEYGLIKFLRGVTGFKFLSESGPQNTILDAQGQSRVIFVQGYNVLTIDGFTIKGGVAPSFGYYAGGGLVGHLSSPVIRNCIFKENSADQGGGLWYGGESEPVIENCQFIDNQATYGGGVFLINSSISATFDGCLFRGNSASSYGGGIFLYRVTPLFENCTIYDNFAVERGGGLYCDRLWPSTFSNCTIAENSCVEGSGIYLYREALTLFIQNCIIAFGKNGPAITIFPGSALDIACSDVFGNEGGDGFPAGTTDSGGNFSLDPQFCGAMGWFNYNIQSDSPCAPGNHPDGVSCYLIGAHPVSCGEVLVEKKSWGSIKNLFGN